MMVGTGVACAQDRGARDGLRLVVLVPAYNEADSIGATLAAVLDQTRPADLVVAIPNGCTDDTAAVARSFGVEVMELARLEHKKSEALNLAWDAYARDADVVICLDADTALPSNALADWVRELDGDPTLGGSSSKFTMRGRDYLTRLQRAEFAAWTDTALRRGNTTVLAGTGCAISGKALRDVVARTGQPGPWSYASLTEDWLLTYEIRRLGYRCHVSPTVRAYTDSMRTHRALLGQRMKWQVGTVEDLLRVGVNRYTALDWWQQFAGLAMAALRIAWALLVVALLLTGTFTPSLLWWVAVPAIFALGQGLLTLRIPHRDWMDVVLGFAILPAEHFAWLRAYWFLRGWGKALRSHFTGKQEDLWAAQSVAEIAN